MFFFYANTLHGRSIVAVGVPLGVVIAALGTISVRKLRDEASGQNNVESGTSGDLQATCAPACTGQNNVESSTSGDLELTCGPPQATLREAYLHTNRFMHKLDDESSERAAVVLQI